MRITASSKSDCGEGYRLNARRGLNSVSARWKTERCTLAYKRLGGLFLPPVGVFNDEVVALAAVIFQPGAIFNLDLSAVVANQSCFCYAAGGSRQAGPPR